MSERRTITVILNTYIYIDYEKLSGLIPNLQNLYEQYKEYDPYLEMYDDYDSTRVRLRGTRLETDDEYNKRTQEQKSYEQRRLAEARELLRKNGEL